ncbi:MAG: hypothetical protein KatS3mg087_0800 [Patescibacteria group bacterium]|nr:MAG: hypothetical protein KatS3mg087_0800 [Patescibacteria group bacterium]
MNDFEKLYENLNPEQRKAVDHLEGPMMVIAGAGTGKTQVIAMRIANIIRQTGVEPFNILCLTFTESGVSAMRERLIKILGTSGYYVRVQTFHGFCQEVIEENPQRFVFARELKLLNDLEKIQHLNKVLDSKSIENPLKTYGDPYFYRASILQQISNLKRESVSADDLREMAESSNGFLQDYKEVLDNFIAMHASKITEEEVQKLLLLVQDMNGDSLRNYLHKSFATLIYQGMAELEISKNGKPSYRRIKDGVKSFVETLDKHIPKQMALADIYSEYQDGLLRNGRYDFDDMVLFVLRELTQNKTLLAEYQEKYPYILVDEYQDTNAAQNGLVRLLGEGVEMPNVFVVGDDDQAIYRFQGANLDNILAFHQIYNPHVQIVTLRRNYRSHQGDFGYCRGCDYKKYS